MYLLKEGRLGLIIIYICTYRKKEGTNIRMPGQFLIDVGILAYFNFKSSLLRSVMRYLQSVNNLQSDTLQSDTRFLRSLLCHLRHESENDTRGTNLLPNY